MIVGCGNMGSHSSNVTVFLPERFHDFLARREHWFGREYECIGNRLRFELAEVFSLSC